MQKKKQTDLQLDRGGIESFLCGCCSAHVSSRALMLLFSCCRSFVLFPLKESRVFRQKHAVVGTLPLTIQNSFKAICILKTKICWSESSVFHNIMCMSSITLVSQLCLLRDRDKQITQLCLPAKIKAIVILQILIKLINIFN